MSLNFNLHGTSSTLFQLEEYSASQSALLPFPVWDLDVDSNSPELFSAYGPSTTIPDHEPPATSQRTRRPKEETVKILLQGLQNARITPLDLLVTVLDKVNTELDYYRAAFFKESALENLAIFLDQVWENDKGRKAMKTWMKPHAVSHICDLIHEEMEAAKPQLRMATNQVTPDFIDSWDISRIMEPINTPVWTAILDAATESERARMKEKKSGSRNRVVVR